MKCHICGATLPLHTDRCPDCGHRCQAAQPQAPQSVPTATAVPNAPYTPPNQTKKSRCCCGGVLLLIPLVLVLALLIYAAADIISTNQYADYFDEAPFPDSFFGELIPESIPLPDAADEGCFRIQNGALVFQPENWDGGPVLRVPEEIDGRPVTAIGPGCFRDCDDLTTIVLPDSITSIKAGAFSGCTNLRGLFLYEGLEAIGTDAFAGCAALQAICIPGSVTSIAPGCFDDCASLLYIFYNGPFEDWDSLYSDYITPFTGVICFDGEYYHGAGD